MFELSDAEKATLGDSFASVANDWAAALDGRGQPGTEILADFRAKVKGLRN